MGIDISCVADVVFVKLSGEIRQKDDLLGSLAEYLLRGHNKFVLCFQNVRSINSLGLQSLLEFSSVLENRGGGLRVCNASPEVSRAMKTSRVDQVVTMSENEDIAFVDLLTGIPIGSNRTSVSRYRN